MKKNTKESIVVGIIMGSDSDLPVMSEAGKILEQFGVAYEIFVVSAHRTPDVLYKYPMSAKKKGIQVIIAGAGGSAHLPGMTAAMTTLPVIGVPIKTKTMDGLDSLLSIAQMPPGVPVATVAINGAKNAGLLALQILAINDKTLDKKMVQYKESMSKEVKLKSKKLSTIGYKKYLEQ
jgi:5-(carboxyamino)imidazole ribonucleotide mutase